MLKALWRKFFPSTASGVAVPPALVDHARRFETAPLVVWLRTALERQADAPELPLLQNVVRQAGWHEHDVAKLAVAAAHGAGRWALVLQYASTGDGDGLRRDAGISIMVAHALYELHRPNDAWRSLMEAVQYDEAVTERADFQHLAAAIAYADNRIEEAYSWIKRWRQTSMAIDGLSLSICFEYGDDAEVDSMLRELSVTARASDAMTNVARSMIHLARGEYRLGFHLFESRLGLSSAESFLNSALNGWPRWQGEPLAGRALLVSAEQGLGDTIQMARYLPLLREKGAGVVIVEAQAEAVLLLQASFPDVVVVERRMGAVPPAPTFDVWAGMMSLPHLFGTTAESVPGRVGFLRVPEESAAYWRERVAELAPNGLPRIGLCWSGRRTHRADQRRSLPSEMIFPYIEAFPTAFFSLQKEVPARRPANLIDVADELVTLADTAALIEALDLVVSIDSAPVHLAGALGKEAWLMLPYRYEWRWGLEGESNYWYDSVNVLRQSHHGAWEPLLNEVFNHRLRSYLKK